MEPIIGEVLVYEDSGALYSTVRTNASPNALLDRLAAGGVRHLVTDVLPLLPNGAVGPHGYSIRWSRAATRREVLAVLASL